MYIDAKCDSNELQTSIDNMGAAINRTRASKDVIVTAKLNVRKLVDCNTNVGAQKGLIYDHYEGLCRRMIIIDNVCNDLEIKKNIFEKELKRCKERSKFCLSVTIESRGAVHVAHHFVKYLCLPLVILICARKHS